MKTEKSKITNAERAKALGISTRTLYRMQRDSKSGQSMPIMTGNAPETLISLKMEKLRKEIAILDSKRGWEDFARLEEIFMAGMSCATILHCGQSPEKWQEIRKRLQDAGLLETTSIQEVFNGLELEELREKQAMEKPVQEED